MILVDLQSESFGASHFGVVMTGVVLRMLDRV
jgi:hypothetical protein